MGVKRVKAEPIPRADKVIKDLLEIDQLSPKTVQGYRNIFYQYEQFLKGNKPGLKTGIDFLQTKAHLKTSSLSTYRMALRTYLTKLGVKIPRGELKPLKFNNIREDKFVTRSEVDTLYRCCDKLRDKVAIRLLYHGGFRARELLDLNVGDLDLSNEKINVRGLKGSHEVRRVRLVRPELVEPTVKAYLQQRGINIEKPTKEQLKEPLFVGYQNKRFTYKQLLVNVSKLGESINKPDLTPHWLRHGHVVWCKVHGIPPESTARNIGDNVETTMKIYSHYSEDDRDRDFDTAMNGETGDKQTYRSPIEEIDELRIVNKNLEETISELKAEQSIVMKVLKEKDLI